MAEQTPTIGRIVHYTLSQQDADEINRRRADFAGYVKGGGLGDGGAGYVAHVGNQAREGDSYPALIVRIFGQTPESAVNLQVFLDGNDTFWATSRTLGEGPFHWTWPVRS